MNKLRKSIESTTPPDTALRRQAEEIAGEKAAEMPENLKALSPEDARLLLHELRVHQIELEMQNEELRRTQSELEASRVRYFDLYDLAPVGYFTISEQGLILEANLTAAGLLGVSRGALVKRRLTSFVLPEDQDIYYRHRKLLFETGAPQVCEFRMLHANAAPFWARMAATAAQDADSAPVCRVVVSDITEIKRAEEALIASEIRYRRLFETAKDGVLILDAETGTVVDVNPFLIEMLGYSHEQFLGKAIWELSFLCDIIASKDNFRKLQEEVYLRYDSLPFETFDGRPIEVEFVSNVYEVGDTKVIQCNIRDVTHRKRAIQALRESEQKLKAAVYGSPIPQFVIDRDHRVVYWNKALEELTGLKTEEMVGTDNYWSAFYKEKRPCMSDLLVDGNAGSIPEWYGSQYRKSRLVADAFEVTDFFPDLGEGGKWLSFTAVAIKDSEGNVIGAMETLEDVTGRIKAEIEIHKLNEDLEKRVTDRTAQLQAANKELEAFSYSVSHDLRAPLRALDGFSRILLEDYASLLPEEAISHLDRIRAGALQMGRLIDDLLKFSRLGRQPLTKRSVRPGDLVQEIWEDLAGERKGREVKLSVADMPGCQADPALLRQVYFNLLSNALKFTRRRELAIIEVGCTQTIESSGGVTTEGTEQSAYFVRDNGVGFDMQYADKLFRVFQRLHRPEEYEGTGVGLAIVQRIIARHGGRVWAHSELDKGATFHFTLEPEVANQLTSVATALSHSNDCEQRTHSHSPAADNMTLPPTDTSMVSS